MPAESSNSRKALNEIASIISEVEFDDSTRKRLLKVHNRLSEDLEKRFLFDWGAFFKKLHSPMGLIGAAITIASAVWAFFAF